MDEDMCSYSQQCMDEDMCSYSQQCVENNTVLTQGRIILWAGGSLADDGSTVKTSVPIFNRCLDEERCSYSQQCMDEDMCFVFSTVCGGKHCFDTRQNNPVGLR